MTYIDSVPTSAEASNSELLERIQRLSPKRLALLAGELERRLAAVNAPASEPIAVIGMACRLPGGANTPEGFWELLADSRDAIEEVPFTRWDVAEFYNPQPGVPGKSNTKWGGFVDRIDQFDSAFFGIAPREAIAMDPQQRLLLEVAWEALEQAGEAPESLHGSLTGVFVGISTNDYATLRERQPEGLFDAHAGSGVARSVAAGRLSYFLGLKGPNIALDTACSSSAVAVHMACQSLRLEECRMALTGGVNAILTPQIGIALAQARMLAGDGRCKTFAQSADGFVRSEGCGVIVLKRLSLALSDGDRILGVIRGSAINHDGRSSGLTAPNGPSQETVIRAALRQARVDPADVDYVEAHGTGTVLGDAIELGALGTVFASRPPSESALKLGSVKTNVGHLEAAAGVTSLIKVLLALQHEQLPAHLHVSRETRNPVLAELPLEVVCTPTPWPAGLRPRLAGVSSFGFSGTNAHIVIAEAPPETHRPSDIAETEIVTLSAKTAESLASLCELHLAYLAAHRETSLANLAYTLNTGRSHFHHRLAFLVHSTEDLAVRLAEVVEKGVASSPAYRLLSGFDQPAIAFLFSGQGSQYPAMGAELYQHNSVFRGCVDHCDDLLAGKLTHRLSEVLCGVEGVHRELIHETAWTQPALLAFEYSLAMLWQAWGITPTSVTGHSIGEIAAACVAGVFTLEAALQLACERGGLMATMPPGKMLAARLSEAETLQLIHPFEGLSLAAVNGPRSVVISGDADQIEAVHAELSERSIVSQLLAVSHAFHSPAMDPILNEFEERISRFTFSEPVLPIVSNLGGAFSLPGQLTRPAYWRDHLRGTVRFADGLAAMATQNSLLLLEIGPEATLTRLAKTIVPAKMTQAIASQGRGRDSTTVLYEAVIALYLAGATINWKAVYADRPARKLSLPTYPFRRQRYWIETAPSLSPEKVERPGKVSPRTGPLLFATDWQRCASPTALLPHLSPMQGVDFANDYVAALGRDSIRREAIESYQHFLPHLNALCSLYVLKALWKLSPELWEGSRLPNDTLAVDLGVGANHQRLLERLFCILEEDGLSRHDPTGWTITAAAPQDPEEERQRLAAEFPQFSAELAFLRSAAQLANVLRQETSPLQALFPDGSVQLARPVYQDAPAARLFNEAIAEVVRRIASHNSSSKLKILEVGAGTGSTTASILPLLDPTRTQFLFTDVSQAFLNVARSELSAYPFVQFQTLDLDLFDSWPKLQPVDMIVAANVLHTTLDLGETVRNLRRLLKPGGSLVILEGTSPQRFGDLTVGMTDGWWRFTDLHRRPDYPLISRLQWLDLLAEAGFECAALDDVGWAETLTRHQTILVATPIAPALQAAPAMLLLETTRARSLASHLQSTGTIFDRVEIPSQLDALPDAQVSNGVRSWLNHHGDGSLLLVHVSAHDSGHLVPETVEENAAAMLSILQSVVEAGSLQTRLIFVTHACAAVGDDEKPDLAGCAADALLKTARLEYPQLSSRWIDLSAEPSVADLSLFQSKLTDFDQETSIAIRRGDVFVPRLHAVGSTSSTLPALLRDATYLVTGAYGGLGLNTVEWLVRRGAGCIALMGRGEPPPEVRAKMRLLEQSGVQLIACTGDVSIFSDLVTVFDRIAQSGPPLRGIVHSAGITEDATLLQQSRVMLQQVFAAKVRGSWNLHRAAISHALDFFVFFGSAASTLGSAGQSNHAAANSFLDSLSLYRTSLGLPSLTIAWGPWSGIGAATRVKDTSRGTRAGITPISPEDGNRLLDQALCAAIPTVSALDIDWGSYRQFHPAALTLAVLDDLLPSHENMPGREPASAQILPRLLEADHGVRGKLVEEYLSSRILEALGLASTFVLLQEQPFVELGLDSLMALELKNHLQRDLNLSLSSNFFFEYPNLSRASTAVGALLAGDHPSPLAKAAEFEDFVL